MVLPERATETRELAYQTTVMKPHLINHLPFGAFYTGKLEKPNDTRAICLLSGGLDSSTVLAIAKQQGYECYCLTFDYGQRHVIEVEAARKVASQLGAKEVPLSEN